MNNVKKAITDVTERLNLELSERIIRKAQSYLTKSSGKVSKGFGKETLPTYCIDLACFEGGKSFSMDEAAKFVGKAIADYVQNRKTVAKILDIDIRPQLETLCVTFGCTQLKSPVKNLLECYQITYKNSESAMAVKNMDFESTELMLAAFQVMAKALKIPIKQKDLEKDGGATKLCKNYMAKIASLCEADIKEFQEEYSKRGKKKSAKKVLPIEAPAAKSNLPSLKDLLINQPAIEVDLDDTPCKTPAAALKRKAEELDNEKENTPVKKKKWVATKPKAKAKPTTGINMMISECYRDILKSEQYGDYLLWKEEVIEKLQMSKIAA